MTFIKCELCDVDVSGEKCVFAIHERIIDDKEYHFCSKIHADEFERGHLEKTN